jgi:hypothetical protein
MFRSGTSITANVVHEWGAFGGGSGELTIADENNPRGYWQHHQLGELASQLLQDIGLDFWHPSFPAAARALAAVPRYRDATLALISGMNAEGRIWFWKEPKLSVLLPFWRELCPDTTYIITVRNPYASALSWQKYVLPEAARGKVQLVAASLLWWQTMMMSLLEHTENSPARHFVVYEQLMAHPEEECRKLGEFLCREYNLKPVNHAAITEMTHAVAPELHRMRVQVSLDEIDQATGAQKDLYRFLLAKADNPKLPFNPGLYPFYAGWREHLDNSKLLRDLLDMEFQKAAQTTAAGLRGFLA